MDADLLSLIRRHPASDPALLDALSGDLLNYRDLVSGVEAAAAVLSNSGRRLHFLFCTNSAGSAIAYLGCLAARVPVCLLDGKSSASERIVASYQPQVLLSAGEAAPAPGYSGGHLLPGGFRVWEGTAPPVDLHPELALLLTTSGSTGDPKLVRLTQGNLVSNALAIEDYLGLSADERSVQSLPMSYSYGLSLINSHLIAGGTTVFTPHSFMRPEFWHDFNERSCTSFAGVPHMYETLKRLKFDPARYASLRTLTQAGGKLAEPIIEWFSNAVTRTGRRFFVMYGQTEATARISYVPPGMLAEKVGSIGVAIPGGSLSVEPAVESPDLHELVYSGPNVMMGYATGRQSLSEGDVQGGMLRTGDLARVDEDGFHYIVGRLKRFAKLFGKRVNLLDVEIAVESQYGIRTAALDNGHDGLILYLETQSTASESEIVMEISGRLTVPPNAIRIRIVDELPTTSSGKKDYAAVARL